MASDTRIPGDPDRPAGTRRRAGDPATAAGDHLDPQRLARAVAVAAEAAAAVFAEAAVAARRDLRASAPDHHWEELAARWSPGIRDPQMIRWERNQHAARRAGRLSAARAARLERLPGWTWRRSSQQRFDDGFGALADFVDREGHALVPAEHREDDFPLGWWVLRQRRAARGGRLRRERRDRLEQVPGWSWGLDDDTVAAHLVAAAEFKKREGHLRVPYTHREAGLPLGQWLSRQRAARREGRLEESVESRLDALGVFDDSPAARLDRGVAALVAHLREHGPQVGRSATRDGVALAPLVSQLRRSYHAGRLPGPVVATLDAAPGWCWGESREQRWERGYRALVRFAAREGHCRVPSSHREGDVALGQWVKVQRRAEQRGTLPEARAARLAALPGWATASISR